MKNGKRVFVGRVEWFQNGKLHREDGPAVEHDDGQEWWYLNGELHREGGPAIYWEGVIHEWYIRGKLHREDGPAIEYYLADGRKEEEWWINGVKLSRTAFNKWLERERPEEIV